MVMQPTKKSVTEVLLGVTWSFLGSLFSPTVDQRPERRLWDQSSGYRQSAGLKYDHQRDLHWVGAASRG